MAKKVTFDNIKIDKYMSEKALRISEMIRRGTKTIYDPEYHPELLIALFCEGYDIEAFSFAAEINQLTFFRWVKRHEEFKEAYSYAREYAKLWWMNRARMKLEDREFNTTLWSMIMRNRFGFTEHRNIKIKGLKNARTSKQLMDCIKNAIDKGKITGSEINYLTAFAGIDFKISEMKDFEKVLDDLLEAKNANR